MNEKGIKIKQHDITDCGAACLASICAYYGLRYPVSRIRQYASTDKKGTNLLGLVEAATKLGFSAKGVRGNFEALKIVPKPAIAHIVVREVLQHFIVVYDVTNKCVIYMDPADGQMHQKQHDEFEKEWTEVLVIMEPDITFKPGNVTQSTVRKFFSLLAPHKSMMLQAVFGALIFSILGLSTSIYVGKITDYVLADKNLNLLHLMGVVMIIILCVRTFIGTMKSLIALKTGQRIDAALILGYYKHLLRLPQQFFDTMRVGEIISRVNDAVKIRTFINNVSLDLIVNMLVLFFTTCLMFIYSWKLAIVTLISTPFFFLLYWMFNRLNRKYQRKIMESGAELESQLVESLNSISTIKRFGTEEYANLKTESRFVQLLRNSYHSLYGAILTQSSIQFLSTGITVAVLWYGSILVIEQELTPGTLMIFYSLTGYILPPIGSLITANQTIQDATIAADRLFQIMDLELEQSDGEQKIILESDMIGDVIFKDVSFRYGSRKHVFDALNLTILKGVTTAIVGESGSGKTTLVSLLQNIYPIQSGQIYIGDYNIAQITNESLRQRVGVVPQQIELFNGSIVENIAIGDLQPDMKLIMDIIKQLGLTDFIENQPKGYMTPIGEHGISLSGGERQRIAIARAIYKKTDILIFDESTSALDSISEQYVKQTLKDLASNGKTIILIAHRLSTVKKADCIVVLEQGKVVEIGTHQELCNANGAYSKLWNAQINEI